MHSEKGTRTLGEVVVRGKREAASPWAASYLSTGFAPLMVRQTNAHRWTYRRTLRPVWKCTVLPKTAGRPTDRAPDRPRCACSADSSPGRGGAPRTCRQLSAVDRASRALVASGSSLTIDRPSRDGAAAALVFHGLPRTSTPSPGSCRGTFCTRGTLLEFCGSPGLPGGALLWV